MVHSPPRCSPRWSATPAPSTCRAAARGTTTDAVLDDDLQLALFLLYELHYRGLDGVDDRWEWAPDLLRLRGELEETFEAALADRLGEGPEVDDRRRGRAPSWTTSPAPTPAVG